MKDDEMVLFVESDFGYSPMLKRKQPATGVRRRVIKQFAPPPDDTPELQDARPVVKLFYLGSMDCGHKVDKLVKARRGKFLYRDAEGVLNIYRPWTCRVRLRRQTGVYERPGAASRISKCIPEVGKDNTNYRRLSCGPRYC